MCAAQDGNTEIVELLLQYEARVDLKMIVSSMLLSSTFTFDYSEFILCD